MERKFGFLLFFAVLSFSLSADTNRGKYTPQEFRDGDIIFQQLNLTSDIIAAQGSKYSHCGIIFNMKGIAYVYEAVQPVKITPLDEWIDRGVGDHYVLKRLKESEKLLTKEVIQKMFKAGLPFQGRNYDMQFMWGDDKIYCSELVWKIYERGAGIELVPLKTIGDYNLAAPEAVQGAQNRYGGIVPKDEPVVAPIDLFSSELLVTVGEGGRDSRKKGR